MESEKVASEYHKYFRKACMGSEKYISCYRVLQQLLPDQWRHREVEGPPPPPESMIPTAHLLRQRCQV